MVRHRNAATCKYRGPVRYLQPLLLSARSQYYDFEDGNARVSGVVARGKLRAIRFNERA